MSSNNVRLIAVEQRSRQRRLNMLDDLGVELIFRLELGRRLANLDQQCLIQISQHALLTYFLHLQHPHRQSLSLPIELYIRTYAALCPSGMLASMLLISCGAKPVTVLLCLGLEMPEGPMGP